MWCVGLGADNHANASDTPDWRARKLAHKNAGAEAECAEQAAELSRAEAQRYAREFDPRARENDQERAKEQKRLAKEPEEQLLAHTKGQLERQQQLVWNVLVLFYLFIIGFRTSLRSLPFPFFDVLLLRT
jgi:septal ring factor EnvC (AmiA/AmiB activator)